MNIHDLDTWLAKSLTQFSSSKINKLAPGIFAHQTNLTTVTIPNVTVIPHDAFYSCGNLTTINANNITTLERNSLCGCYSLNQIDLLHVTYIDSYAIDNNYALLSIDLSSLNMLRWGGIYDFYGKLWLPSTCTIDSANFNYKNSDTAVIYTDALEKPDSWDNNWNQGGYPVVWGATHEDFENA